MRAEAVRGARSTALIALAGIVGMAGCASGPNEADLEAQSDLAWRTTVGTAEQAIARLPALFPDVRFERNDVPEEDDYWSDCSSSSQGNALDPTAIQWFSMREVVVDPPRETATFARALVESYVADGWTATDEQLGGAAGEGLAFDLRRQGYGMRVLATNIPGETAAPLVRVITFSPCLDAPDRMGDRPWQPGPTEPPAPTGQPSAG